MAKYSLTIDTEDLGEIVHLLTPALVTAVKGAEVFSAKVEEVPVAVEEKAEPEAKPAAKRGRKPRAVEPECAPEPVVEQPVAEEKAEDDFGDAFSDEEVVLAGLKKLTEDAAVTKQQVTDAAIEVGSKHGRDVMIAAITKFTATGKLAGVAESDYLKLHKVLTELASLDTKLKAKAYLDSFTV